VQKKTEDLEKSQLEDRNKLEAALIDRQKAITELSDYKDDMQKQVGPLVPSRIQRKERNVTV